MPMASPTGAEASIAGQSIYASPVIGADGMVYVIGIEQIHRHQRQSAEAADELHDCTGSPPAAAGSAGRRFRRTSAAARPARRPTSGAIRAPNWSWFPRSTSHNLGGGTRYAADRVLNQRRGGGRCVSSYLVCSDGEGRGRMDASWKKYTLPDSTLDFVPHIGRGGRRQPLHHAAAAKCRHLHLCRWRDAIHPGVRPLQGSRRIHIFRRALVLSQQLCRNVPTA